MNELINIIQSAANSILDLSAIAGWWPWW